MPFSSMLERDTEAWRRRRKPYRMDGENPSDKRKNREAAIITEDLQMENQTKERSYRV
jgi:hypothetical protein